MKQWYRWARWLLIVGVFVVVEMLLMDRIPEWFRWLQVELLLLAYVFARLWMPRKETEPEPIIRPERVPVPTDNQVLTKSS